MTTNIHIDIESYSEVDICKAGAYRYAEDPSTEVLMMAWAVDDAPVQITDSLDEIRNILFCSLLDEETIFWAHNANFERVMLREVLGIDIPIERWRCTQVLGYHFAFSGGLGDMVGALGASADKQKDKAGRRLIHRFSKPQPKNHKVQRWTKENDPEGWAEFMDYCRQDVVAERELHSRLGAYGLWEGEWSLYHLDQKINDRGVPLDMQLVDNALIISKREKTRLLEEMDETTGLKNSGSNSQIKPWLADHGLPMPNMQKDTVSSAIALLESLSEEEINREWHGDNYYEALSVLRLKQQHAKTSVTKFAAMKRAVCRDGRLHGMFQFGGASRTRRWAGRLVQLQNLARPSLKDPCGAADLISTCGYDAAAMLYPDLMEMLSSTVRGAIKAPEGRTIIDPDLSSIESRVVGWITNCEAINKTFAAGLDTYKIFATRAYGVGYEDVTKKQRKQSKPPVLGGPYGLGAKGLVTYADSMGISMSLEEAQEHTNTLRSEWHEIPTFWRWIVDAVFRCARTGAEVSGYCVRVYAQGEFLRIELPSGRSLSYFRPKIIKKKAPWGDVIDNFSFMGVDTFTKKWTRITAHGGFLLENITQAIAADILGIWLQRADAVGFDLFLHVHDEVGALEDEDKAEARLQELIELARVPIPWAPGLVLDADGEGYPSKRFKK